MHIPLPPTNLLLYTHTLTKHNTLPSTNLHYSHTNTNKHSCKHIHTHPSHPSHTHTGNDKHTHTLYRFYKNHLFSIYCCTWHHTRHEIVMAWNNLKSPLPQTPSNTHSVTARVHKLLHSKQPMPIVWTISCLYKASRAMWGNWDHYKIDAWKDRCLSTTHTILIPIKTQKTETVCVTNKSDCVRWLNCGCHPSPTPQITPHRKLNSVLSSKPLLTMTSLLFTQFI